MEADPAGGRLARLALAGLLALAAACGAASPAGVAATAEEAIPLGVGQRVPDATLRNLDGRTVALASLHSGGAFALVFYRGGWCPYCDAQLSELRDAIAPLEELGVRVVAVSPDRPEKLRETLAKRELGYRLLSDSRADAMRAFGIAFRVSAARALAMKGYGIDLEDAAGESHHLLPVPSVFLVDGSGVIRFVHSDPDYKVRLSNAALLDAARGLERR